MWVQRTAQPRPDDPHGPGARRAVDVTRATFRGLPAGRAGLCCNEPVTLLLQRLRLWWSQALWVIPLGGILAAWGVAKFLERYDEQLHSVWSNELSPSAAQAFLAAVGGGMVTFTGFVFSVVLLMLQYGSSMYSPRAASYFLRKRTTQWVLAVFLGTIALSFSQLISVGSLGRADYVPVLSVALVLLALFASLMGFLVLLQTVAAQLRVDSLLSTIGRMSRTQMHRQPWAADTAQGSADPSTDGTGPGRAIETPAPLDTDLVRYEGRPGQLVDVALGTLTRIARDSGAEIRLLVRVGDGISEGAPVAVVTGLRPGDRELSRCLLVRAERSLRHDPLYALRLVVDVALRALSPAVNDPTTAVRALDEIEDVLRTAARLPLGPVRRTSGDGAVVLPRAGWSDVVDLALLEIIEAGLRAPQVTRRLTALLGDLLADLPEAAHAPLLRYRRRLTDEVTRTLPAQDHAIWLTGDRQGIGGSR